jgi:hypothetical protein
MENKVHFVNQSLSYYMREDAKQQRSLYKNDVAGGVRQNPPKALPRLTAVA